MALRLMELTLRWRLPTLARRLALSVLGVALAAGLPGARANDCPPLPGVSAPQKPAQKSEKVLDIQADRQSKVKEVFDLQGHVVATYGQWKLRADEATYDETTGEVVARGHVVFDDPQAHLEADEAHYNVQTGQGWFKNGHGYMHGQVRTRPRLLVSQNPFYVQARRVVRIDDSTYNVEHGRMSTCQDPGKGWSISARRAHLEVGEKVVSHGAMFQLLHLPLFYSPFLVNAVGTRARRVGFLLPQIGNSGQKGTIIGDGFFWPINRSSDLFFGVQNYSLRGLGTLGHFRARPSESSMLDVDFFHVNDRGFGPDRSVRAPGENLRVQGYADDLGYGFRGVVNVDYINSLGFRQTFTDNFTEAVTSEVRQTGFLTKSFDGYSLNFSAERYQNFLSATPKPGNSVVIQQVPSVFFSGMDHQIGRTPFFFAVDTSLTGVSRTDPTVSTPGISGRFDLYPQLTLRTKAFWGFHFTPTAAVRLTRYGTSLNADHSPLTRALGELGFDLRPPSFEKVFNRKLAGRRIKHVIEPDIRYRLVRARDPEQLLDIVRFDETDIFVETNEIEYSLTNSLLTRKDATDASGEAPPARELISWRLSQKYYFDPTFGGALVPGGPVTFDTTLGLSGFAFARGQRLSPLVSVLKFAPATSYDTEIRADFNPHGGVLNAGITSNLHRKSFGLAFTDFFINRTAGLPVSVTPSTPLQQIASFNLLRTVASYGDVNRKGLSGAFGIDYNFAQGITQQAVSQVGYNFGCFGIDFEYRRFDLGVLRRENQFRVAISLANVGTFGNLKSRERLY